MVRRSAVAMRPGRRIPVRSSQTQAGAFRRFAAVAAKTAAYDRYSEGRAGRSL